MIEFLKDMIHLTEGEKLLKYWWLWSIILIAAFMYLYWTDHRGDDA